MSNLSFVISVLPPCATSRALYVYHVMRFTLPPYLYILTPSTRMHNSDVHFYRYSVPNQYIFPKMHILSVTI